MVGVDRFGCIGLRDVAGLVGAIDFAGLIGGDIDGAGSTNYVSLTGRIGCIARDNRRSPPVRLGLDRLVDIDGLSDLDDIAAVTIRDDRDGVC